MSDWTYDAWGNRTDQTVTGGTCNTFHQSMNGNNQISGSPYTYDAAGNMTHDASHSYTYDAENHITKVDGGSTATYGYDADGRRVSRVVAGVETDYIYDLSGHVVATYGGGCGSTCLNTAFMYSNGQLVAEYNSGATYFVSIDHLGSTRLLTGYPTASVVECDDYYPFGESISCGATGTTTHKFTGYERDTETNLDNAQARYFSSPMGRFMSPDPVGIFVADATNPQSWNLYSYVDNDPIGSIDPSGLDSIRPPLPAPPSIDPFDCVPLIYRRGDPWDAFDAETPYGGGLNTVSTCEGFPQPRPVTGGGSGGGRGHGGPTIGPAPPQKKKCRPVDPILGALELKLKAGPEVQLGPAKAGFSLYKNLTSGETGGSGDLTSGLAGVEADNPTPPGGNLGGASEGTQTKVSFAGFEKNLTTGQPITFKPSANIKLGLQAIIGFELSFNSDTFNQINLANAACFAQGGG